MKTAIHPTWYPEAQVQCACGHTFTIGSTVPQMHVEVCSACHPFYTGVAKFIDIKGRVDRFQEKLAKRAEVYVSKKDRREVKRQKRIQEELEKPESLGELRNKK